MMRSFFDSVPRALEEAAWIDGCGVWGAFLRIVLPLAAPGVAATGVLCFILSWNDFFFALILTRTQRDDGAGRDRRTSCSTKAGSGARSPRRARW